MADLPDGQLIMRLYVKELTRRLTDSPGEMKAADFEHIRKLLADNSITLASIQRGEFGEMAKRVAEEFPFKDESSAVFQ